MQVIFVISKLSGENLILLSDTSHMTLHSSYFRLHATKFIPLTLQFNSFANFGAEYEG